MKKIILVLSVLALCVCVLVSCEADMQDPPTETTDSTPTTDTPTTDDTKEPTTMEKIKSYLAADIMRRDGKHVRVYGDISPDFLHLHGPLTRDQVNDFVLTYDKSYLAGGGYGTLIEYFGITKEQFVYAFEKELERLGYASWEEHAEYELSRFNDVDLAPFYEVWFSEDYDNHELFVHPDYVKPEIDSVKIRCETDDVHMDVYYTIDRKLITYVGLREFNKFKEEFGGTEEFNIIHFIDYFDISREEYESIYPKWIKPYSIKYLYGTAEMHEKYFCRHPING